MDFILQTFYFSKKSHTHIYIALDVQSIDLFYVKKYLFLARFYRDFLFILYTSLSNVTLPHTLVTIVSFCLNVTHALPPFIRHSGHLVACDEFYANLDRLQYLSLVYKKRRDWRVACSTTQKSR